MAIKDETYFSFLRYAIEEQAAGRTWDDIGREYTEKFGEPITKSGICHRCGRYAEVLKAKGVVLPDKPEKVEHFKETSSGEFTEIRENGDIVAKKIIQATKELLGDKRKLLEYLGYKPSEWQFETIRYSIWDGAGDGNKSLYAVQYKLKPKKGKDVFDIVKAVKEALEKTIEPVELPKHEHIDGLDNEKLMEIPPVELHLGKLSNEIETGENYDLPIARKRFDKIFQEIYARQRLENCGKCLLVIGSDFFNSESDNATSVNKIPQQNDTRYIKLFMEGIKMYAESILTLRQMFNKVDVMLCAGNHAQAMETFLYIALQQRFMGDDVVTFKENYRQTQAFTFGRCAIFYNHGDINLKRTIGSIPTEFPEVWGKAKYRELHMGHLHKESVDDEFGMIARRVGSPCSADAWHYKNRWIGATKKHEIFVWHANNGLQMQYNINF